MNILHISTPASWRGGEQQLAYLALELRTAGAEQVFACTQGGEVQAFCVGEELVSFPLAPGFLALNANAALVKRICRNYAIDIIHTHDSKAHTMAYISALLGNRTPLVVSRRVDFPVGKTWLSRKKYNHPMVKRILCVSEKIKEVTGASIQNKEVLATVYSGIDTSRVEAPYPIRGKYKLANEVKLIGNVAALAPHKDYFTFVDTVRILLDKGLNAKFFMIGEGPSRTEIERYIAEKQLQEHIIMTGFTEDAKAMLAALDVMLVTSETEGLGTSILDAFVQHTPVVATAAGGITEIVKDRDTGLLAPLKDAAALAEKVIQLLADDALRHRLVAKAAIFVKQFDKSVTAQKTLDHYRQVMQADK